MISLLCYLIILFNITLNVAWAQIYKEIRPQPDDTSILFNPGMGLVINHQPFYKGMPHSNLWRKPIINIAYTRFKWADLEHEEGKYDFSIIKAWIKPWLTNGYRVAFGVYSTNVKETCTPSWVFKAGVPAVKHRGGQQKDPVYWDPLYIKKYEPFVKKLGETFDGMQGLEYVDIRGIGVWGEMHLGTFLNGMWTKQELDLYGFTIAKHVDAYKKMIDQYRQAFPKTQLFLNVGLFEKTIAKHAGLVPHNELVAYAVSKGIGMRYDGLSLTEKTINDIISNTFREECSIGKTGPTRVKCNYEFASNLYEPKLFDLTLKQGLSDSVSYIAPIPDNMERPSEEHKRAMREAAAKIGYRFTLSSLNILSDLDFQNKNSVTVPTKQVWINNGVAHCYREYHLAYAISDSNGKTIYEERFTPDPLTTEWIPNTPVLITKSMKIPSSIRDGIYDLNVFMFDPENQQVIIKLGMKGGDKQGRYRVAGIQITSPRGKRIIEILP
jgi:hypothetical protein